MRLGETINHTLERLHFRPKKPVVTTSRYERPPLPEYIPPEYPAHLIIKSQFGENAENGNILTQTQLALKSMTEGGIGFWKPNSVPDFDTSTLQEVIQGPNSGLFAETFTTIEEAVDNWDYSLLNLLHNGRDRFRHWSHRYRVTSMYLPSELTEKAPPSFKKFVRLAHIVPENFRHNYLNIETEGLYAQLSHSKKGRAGIKIGALSATEPQHSQEIAFYIDPSKGSSDIHVSFFASSFTPSKEFLNYLESFGDEARRARLFKTLAKFLANCLDSPDVIRTPWDESAHDRPVQAPNEEPLAERKTN